MSERDLKIRHELLRKFLAASPPDDSLSEASHLKSRRPLSPSKQAELLRARLDALTEPQEFSVGDLVTWKDGMRNKTEPDYGAYGIVVEVLEPPLISESESSGSPYYRERLDTLLGVLDSDEDLALLHVDGRRFKKV